MSLAEAVGVLQQETGHLFRLGEAVGIVLGQDMPDGHQPLAGDPLSGLDTLTFPETTASGAVYALNGVTNAARSRVYPFDQSSTFSATVAVTAADRAGNVRAASFGVVHDTTPPLVTLDAPSSSGLIVPIHWQGQDGESGLRSYTIRYSPSLTGPWTDWLTNTTATFGQFPGAANQAYYFQVEAVDNVNNTATAQAGPVTVHSVTKYYYHGDTRVAMRQGDVVYFLHSDHLGSTSLTTDDGGTVVSEVRYFPYGEERWTDGETPTDFTFTGQRAEMGFGLYDYNARYYDSGSGRFISPDTIVPEPGNPQSLNRYSYVLNRPVGYTDPSGHWGGDVMDLAVPMDTYEGMMGGGGGGLVIALAVSTIIIAQNAPEISEAMSDVFIPPYVPADQEGFTLQESSSSLSPGPTLDMPAWDPVYSYPLGANGDQTIGLDFPNLQPGVLGDGIYEARWKVGDPINAQTKKGYPSWTTVQERYWKNRASSALPGEFSDGNIERMKAGNAPLHPQLNVPQELHHINGRNIPDPHNISNLRELWPWEHAAVDPFRTYTGPRP